MKQMNSASRLMVLGTLAATLTGSSLPGAMAQTQSQTRVASLEAGSVLPVTLDDALSSKDSHKGDTFTATIRKDTATDYYRLPAGTRIEGVVRDVRSQTSKDPGVLDLTFRRIRFPDGRSTGIEGSLIGLDNKSVEKRTDGRLIAKPTHRTDRLTYVGYGAGAGLIVGLLTKRTLEGTVIGGGLGYLFGALEKGDSKPRDVALKTGTELGVRLDQTLSLVNYSGAEDNRNNQNRQNGNSRINRSNETNNSDFHYPADNQSGNRIDRSGERRNGQNTRDGSSGKERQDTSDIGVLVGEKNVEYANAARPFMTNGVVMVPVRQTLDAVSIPFRYDAVSKELRATGNSGSVRVVMNSAIAVVDGRRVRMEAPVQQKNGVTYAPLKFFSLVTGHDAAYDSGSRTVLLNQPEVASDPAR